MVRTYPGGKSARKLVHGGITWCQSPLFAVPQGIYLRLRSIQFTAAPVRTDLSSANRPVLRPLGLQRVPQAAGKAWKEVVARDLF